MQISVFIADDHALMREGLRSLLEVYSDMTVVGVAESGLEAVREVLRLRPQIVLMDISMPDLSGIEATRQLADLCPASRVIMLSLHGTAEHCHQAIRAGACGYLLKECATEELARAVRSVHAGRQYVSSTVAGFRSGAAVRAPGREACP